MVDPIDVIDSIIDAIDQPQRPSDVVQDAETKLLENIVKGLQKSAGSNRAVRVISIVVIGGKIIKLLFGGEVDSGGLFLPIDELIAPDYTTDPLRVARLVDRLQTQISGAGIVVMDPVWLRDPKV